jgi:hypothetical protein
MSSATSVAGIQAHQAVAASGKAADGDHKTASANTSQVKDSDGDYKAIAATGSAARVSSNGTLSALSSLKTGG